MTEEAAKETKQEPLRSVHTKNFPEILKRLGISLLVSTYQAGKLILLREDNGILNTHFRTFKQPMGIAAAGNRLAVGCATEIWELRNIPAVTRKLDPPGKHDAFYMPRQMYVTGNIDVHETAWGRDGRLRLINTRFSCLCTVDTEHSFVPLWKPHFITALTPEDRCHLNGLCMVNGEPEYVTALGETDSNESWRKDKVRGGILMDVKENKILMRGLSMPHSPRRYDGRLWILESGEGSLSIADVENVRLETVAQLPGFTRGIDFCGELAFIGLSKVRDSALFIGLPLTERLDERVCGVWVVNIRTRETVAFLRFEEAVQEIFAVQVLHGIRFPDIADWGDERISNSYIVPDDALADVPESLK